MVDVAREAGVALGTLYSYVASKEALFALALDSFFVDSGGEYELPIAAPDAGALLVFTRDRLELLAELPVLEAAGRRRRARDARGELADVLGELWDLTLRTRLGADMIERSARQWPQLAELFYGQIRRRVIDRVTAYVAQRARNGQFRAFPDATLAARMALETITWWARHRYGDPDAGELDDGRARAAVMPLLLDALVDT